MRAGDNHVCIRMRVPRVRRAASGTRHRARVPPSRCKLGSIYGGRLAGGVDSRLRYAAEAGDRRSRSRDDRINSDKSDRRFDYPPICLILSIAENRERERERERKREREGDVRGFFRTKKVTFPIISGNVENREAIFRGPSLESFPVYAIR